MADYLDKLEIEIPCTNCNRKTKKSIGWIKGNSEFICICGTKIRLDASQFKAKIADAERSITRLKDNIEKLNK